MQDEKVLNKKQTRTKFTNEFSEEIFSTTYCVKEESVDGMHERVAYKIAECEKDSEYWANQFMSILQDFQFVPGGRILSNAGAEFKGTTMINCFVDGFVGENRDSMDGILSTLRRQALILKSEGGYGFCADTMRPRGAFIDGIGNESPGSVKMLDMWDTQSTVITEGSGRKSTHKKAKSKIRKGAQMVTMSCWHPDVEEFITSKQQPGRLTKFNMSVLITDDFMEAVENNKPWDLVFPDYEFNIDTYDKEWDGNIKNWIEKGYPVKVYKTYEDANQLWDVIMESTYNRNEPGVLFVDTMNKLNNLYYNEYISATNPCGEQILPTGGVCLLGSLNLTQFIKDGNWDYEKLGRIIPIAIRFMDNVNDVTYVPLDIQRENLKNKRRIGLGIMGYGSALAMMQKRYGSDDALKMTDDLMSFIADTAYQASAKIAGEKGTFELYDAEKYLKSEFLKNLDPTTIGLIKKYGMRNSHLLSIQPTGNTSSLSNIVSSGLEPMFLPEYIRTAIMPHIPEHLTMPVNINWENNTVEEANGWSWIKEGDEGLLRFVDDNKTVYKIDQNRGLTKENLVRDFSVQFFEANGIDYKDKDWFVDTSSLNIDDHIKTMKIMAKYIDSAMSKTLNLPNDYPYEEFKKVYREVHASGVIKGATTYRAGTMTTVLSEVGKDEQEITGITKTHAPKRPKDMICDIHHLTVNKDPWIVIVGLFEHEPYEVFAFKQQKIQLPKKLKNGILRKIKRGVYDLMEDDSGEGLVINDIKEFFARAEEEALTRVISTALRHGADVKFVIEQLNKSEGTVVSFSKAIARTLKKYVKDGEKISGDVCLSCGSTNIVYEDGCFKCLDCGGSKC